MMVTEARAGEGIIRLDRQLFIQSRFLCFLCSIKMSHFVIYMSLFSYFVFLEDILLYIRECSHCPIIVQTGITAGVGTVNSH